MFSSFCSRSNGRAETNFHSMLQEDSTSRPNFPQEIESPQVQKDWSPKNFSGGSEDSSLNAFKQINQVFNLEQKRLNPENSSGDCPVTCEGLPTSFPMGAASYRCPSSLLQGLFEPESQPQHSPYENRSMSNPFPTNYRMNTNEFSPSWPKFSQFLKSSPPKQQSLHFSNNAPFWNASAAAVNDVRSTFFPSSQTQFLTPTFEEKPNCSNLTAKVYLVIKKKITSSKLFCSFL